MGRTCHPRIHRWRIVVPPHLVAFVSHGVLGERLGNVVLEVLDGHGAEVVQLVRDFVQATHGRCVGRHVAEDTSDFVKNLVIIQNIYMMIS